MTKEKEKYLQDGERGQIEFKNKFQLLEIQFPNLQVYISNKYFQQFHIQHKRKNVYSSIQAQT